MLATEVPLDCSADVLVSVAELLHVYPGLLTAAAVCGGLAGLLAAAILYVFCMKPLLLTRQVSTYRTAFILMISFKHKGYIYSSPCRFTMQGDCWNLMLEMLTTKVSVSATARRRPQVVPPKTRYLSGFLKQHVRFNDRGFFLVWKNPE